MVIPSIETMMNSDGRVMYGQRMVQHLDPEPAGPEPGRVRGYVLVSAVYTDQLLDLVGD